MKLKTLRKRKALSQRDLAEKAGISVSTLNRIEQRLQEAMPSTRRKIAAALGVEPEDIQW